MGRRFLGWGGLRGYLARAGISGDLFGVVGLLGDGGVDVAGVLGVFEVHQEVDLGGGDVREFAF